MADRISGGLILKVGKHYNLFIKDCNSSLFCRGEDDMDN